MSKSTLERHSGILNRQTAESKFRLSRHRPAPDIGAFVERYWIITWDLEGQEPHVQETLPNACVNLVVERGCSRVYGLPRGKSARRLENKGRVFGIKFRPGAFYPFVKWPLSRLTGSSAGLPEIFGVDGGALEEAILCQEDEAEMVAGAEDFLRLRLPAPDEMADRIARIVDQIIDDRALTQVEEVARRLHVDKRTLQRLFKQYVGASPKWVIRCYRLQEAAGRLAGGEVMNWPRLALELGYFDQAHFIKDFKAMVGMPPAEYAREAG